VTTAAPAGRRIAVRQAFRQAGRFDRANVSTRAGLIACIPVAAMMALGTALGSPSAAVTMGVGALLTGVAWRAGEGPLVPPIGTMAGAAAALAIATLAGTLSGHWPWLHLLVLVIFCLVAGIAACLGRRGLVIGTQSVIAFIVFGRFPENVPDAFALTGLVLAGGAAQTLFAATVAVPFAWRRQREALAAAYSSLAHFSRDTRPTAIPSAAALDAADQALAAPALFADPERGTLAGVVSEGRRLRLELIAFALLLGQVRRTDPKLAEASDAGIDDALARIRELLTLTVAAIEGDPAAVAALPAEAISLRRWGSLREPLPSGALDARLAALIGQVTAAARLAAAVQSPGRAGSVTPVGRPTLGSHRFGRQAVSDLQRMRANATLHSAAGRHALRLAVVVALTELLVQRIALPRAYWAVVAAATVLRPGFGATFTRGAERVVGTCAGVVLSTLIAVALDPNGWGVVAVVAVLAFFTYSVFPASFTAGTALMTGVIVFLLHAVSPDTAQTALDRGIDTAIGGAIGLIAYAVWPTWSSLSAGPLLATLVDAQHVYLNAVLTGLVTGRRAEETRLRALARNARLAFADAQAAIGLARSEPQRGDSDPQAAATTLDALRRVVYGVHAVRLDAATAPDVGPVAPLQPLQAGLGEALSELASTLRDDPDTRPQLPPLRRLHRDLARAHPGLLNQALWAALDELVDATDTAAAAVGLTVP
jgi:uncharacterized membrane protein YccC